MREVKSYLSGIYKLTCLLNMGAENSAKCCLKKMSSRVIAHNGFSAFLIYGSIN